MSPVSRGLQTDAIVGEVFSPRELAGFFGLGTCDIGGIEDACWRWIICAGARQVERIWG